MDKGTVGLDSASPDVNEESAYASGSRFRMRYSAGAATSPRNASYDRNSFKLCRGGEIDRIIKSGQDFIADDEWYTNRTTEGKGAAAQDAPVVLDFWKSVGLAKGASIMLNLDTSYSKRDLLGIQNYIDEYNRHLDGYYLADGFYGGIPLLVALSKSGHTRHGWIPSAASWSVPDVGLNPKYAPPADSAWDLWQPTKSQVAPAMAYLLKRLAGHKLESCIWQNGNYRFGTSADENHILIAGQLGSHLEAKGGAKPAPVPTHKPSEAGKPTPVGGSYTIRAGDTLWAIEGKHKWKHGTLQGLNHGLDPKKLKVGSKIKVPGGAKKVLAWPGKKLKFGANDYFGNIKGDKHSHGGFHANEKPYVKEIQKQLIKHGYAGKVKASWADGVYGKPTVDAVTRFQKDKRAKSTSRYGEVWSDDWKTLFSL